MDYQDTLDAVGLLCPLPVLKARKRLSTMQSGQVLRILADDPAAIVDVPHFCAEQGHSVVKSDTSDKIHIYLVQKG